MKATFRIMTLLASLAAASEHYRGSQRQYIC